MKRFGWIHMFWNKLKRGAGGRPGPEDHGTMGPRDQDQRTIDQRTGKPEGQRTTGLGEPSHTL